MGNFRLNRHNRTTILCLFYQTSIIHSMHPRISMHHRTNISRNISTISTQSSNHTLKEGVVETSKEEEEEDLEKEEVRLHAITVDNQVTIPDISWNMQRHVHTVRDMTIMWSNVLS